MSPDECRAKANALCADARRAEVTGNDDIATRCRVMAAILGFMADDDPSRRERGAKLYNESRADFEAFVRKTGPLSGWYFKWK